MRVRRTSPAFTLVELLVVMGVIAVLIAMLLPAISRARENAVLIKCASNMRQMGLVLRMYANDQREYPYYNYPGAPDPSARTWPGGGQSWAGNVCRWETYPVLKQMHYLGAYEVGFCPKAWAARNFDYAPDPVGQYDKIVMYGGVPHWNSPYQWRPRYSNGAFTDGSHMSVGEYMYAGPGSNCAWWDWEGVSTKISREFGNSGSFPDDRINNWVGVRSNGRVMYENYGIKVSPTWTNKRVPLMGEAAVYQYDLSTVSAPHMSKIRYQYDWSVDAGFGNYLFNDGSVEAYRFADR